jgi:hypothetical protein
MTKTPILSALSSRNVASRKLKEPFLLPSGKIQSSGPIERSKLSVRWLVLFLASLLLTCTYYCYDNPSALYKPLAEQFGHVDGFDYWFDAMYSVYSIPVRAAAARRATQRADARRRSLALCHRTSCSLSPAAF